MSRIGIFTKLSGRGFAGMFGLGDTPAEQFAAACRQRCQTDSQDVLESEGYSSPDQCSSACDKFVSDAVTCAPKCSSYRQDSNEWLYCIQKCHGLTTSQAYDEAQKQQCAGQGMTYSWIESKCVDTKSYNSCPAGTIYATYSDGSSKCIGINTDLSKTTCPEGTTLKQVPSPDGKSPAGVACVSPVSPTPAKTQPVPVKATPGSYTPPSELVSGSATLAGMNTSLLLMGVGALALIGIVYMAKKKKKPLAAAPNRRRRRRRY